MWSLEEEVQFEREDAQREAAALREKVTELGKNGEQREKATAEAGSLRKANARLEEENRELARRLQDAENISSSVSLVHEVVVAADVMPLLLPHSPRSLRELHQRPRPW